MIAVVIPCYQVKKHILDVLNGIGPEVAAIYCVDDACPDGTGRHIEANNSDKRVRVLYHETNQGVGGATITGYQAAVADRATIIVKVDGDGQMDPALIATFIRPIEEGRADYTKGNRFFRIENLRGMPLIRLVGNSGLSLMSKFSSGYWSLFDPTNGFTAIHTKVLRQLPLDKIARRYFFESDMLFHLGTIRAVVTDIPMAARYGEEKSGLQVSRVVFPFFLRHGNNFLRRVFYNYFLRDFNAGTLELLGGVLLFPAGLVFGIAKWTAGVAAGIAATAGTVMLAALPIILGFQMLVGFLNYDMRNVPTQPIHPHLP